MKKFVFAAVCTVAVVGLVMADEFTATITKVDGNTVTFKKGGVGGGFGKKKEGAEEPKEEKAEAAANVKVAKGEFDLDAGKDKGAAKGGKGGFNIAFKAGEEIKEGLKSETFTKAGDKGVFVQITTDDKGKITQILVPDFGGAGKAKGGFAKGAADGKKGGFAKGAADGKKGG